MNQPELLLPSAVAIALLMTSFLIAEPGPVLSAISALCWALVALLVVLAVRKRRRGQDW